MRGPRRRQRHLRALARLRYRPPTSIGEGEEPPGATSWENGFGETGYVGPLPRVGYTVHRYFFRLYALPRQLDLEPGAPLEEVRQVLDDERLATGTLVGLYAR